MQHGKSIHQGLAALKNACGRTPALALALQEAAIIVATIVRHFTLELPPDQLNSRHRHVNLPGQT
jgi:cytochrome P450